MYHPLFCGIIMKFRLFACLIALIATVSSLYGCGSAASDDVTIGNNEGPSLAEVAANLPRPDAPLIAPSNNNNSESSGDNNADNVTVIDDRTTVTITGPQTQGGTSSTSGSRLMRRFLWKPHSEGDGNLVVLVDPPGIRVEVFGSISETLRDFGPSNGRGTTARGSFPGCAYGTGIRVQFYRGSQRVSFIDGQGTVFIPDGCSRVEFNL